ncbi:MAG: response regulator [Gemmatimonadales bacterium]|nr:MAG: response regulator [Gemmatimonadales bacterium]
MAAHLRGPERFSAWPRRFPAFPTPTPAHGRPEVDQRPEGTGTETTPFETLESAPIQGEVIRVALIEDNRLVREALVSILNRAPDIQAVAEAPSGYEVLLKDGPHVVLLDLGFESGDSLRVAQSVLEDSPEVRVIVMDLLPELDDLQEFVSAGVSGFILKDAPLDVVLTTIRSVASGLKVLPDALTVTLFSEIAREVVASGGGSMDHEEVRLTPREREVIDLIADGLSNKAIGKELHISVHTVKSHLRNIMEKLTLNSRLQIASYVHQRDTEAEDLRRRAEDRVREVQEEEDPGAIPPGMDGLSLDQVREMLHELKVHQIELEMQNEELRQSRTELELSRERYFDLFDLAPVGYFTLTEDAQILEANLTGAKLLGASRSDLLDRPFTRFILPEDQDGYYHHRRAVINTGSPATLELRMVRADGSVFHALLESAPSRPVDDHATFRTVVSDVSVPEQEPGARPRAHPRAQSDLPSTED